MTNIKQDQNLSKIQGENQSTNLTCASPAYPSKKAIALHPPFQCIKTAGEVHFIRR